VYDAPFPSDGGLTPEQLPTAVTSVWSADDAAATGMTLSDDGLTVTPSGLALWRSIRTSISKTSEKLYVEFYVGVVTSGYNIVFGVASSEFNIVGLLGSSDYSTGIWLGSTNYVSDSFISNYTSNLLYTFAQDDVVSLAIDFNAGSIWVAKNNVWSNSSDPATGSLPIISFDQAIVGPLFAGISFNGLNNGVWTLQATAASQKYTPPAGFEAWDPPMSNGPPITSAPVPPSIAGIPQPVFIPPGSATVPPTPIQTTGTPIIPPPPIANPVGYPVFPPVTPNTAPVAVPRGPLVGPAVGPAPVPPSIPGVTQPQFIPPGSGTVPTAASLFPAFSTTAPSPPIVFANVFKIGAIPPPLPSTPGQNPPAIIPSPVPTIPQLPWKPPPTNPPPVNTVLPAITPLTDLVVGSQLALTTGTWTGSGPFTYARMWTRNGSPIAGAIAASYTTVAADIGAMIGGNVTATDSNGLETSAQAFAVGPIEDVPPPLDEPETLPAPPPPVRHGSGSIKPRTRKKR
jgi:hypothetical protein